MIAERIIPYFLRARIEGTGNFVYRPTERATSVSVQGVVVTKERALHAPRLAPGVVERHGVHRVLRVAVRVPPNNLASGLRSMASVGMSMSASDQVYLFSANSSFYYRDICLRLQQPLQAILNAANRHQDLWLEDVRGNIVVNRADNLPRRTALRHKGGKCLCQFSSHFHACPVLGRKRPRQPSRRHRS